MLKTKLISKILYIACLIMGLVYLVTTVYALGCKLLGVNMHLEGKKEIIEYPFTHAPFLILEANWYYWVFSFLIPILFYTLFFFFLANVFKVFFRQRIFTASNIIHLKRFYYHNLFLPIVLVGLTAIFVEIETPVFMIVALHLFLGVFVFILSEIFNQGLHLQHEQDLYI